MNNSSKANLFGIALLSTTVAIAIGSILYLQRRRRKPSNKRRVTFRHPISSSSFKKMALPETKAPVLGLLFAASWCPDCTDVVPAVGKVAADSSSSSFLEVFYVSSDRTEDEMKSFQPKSISSIPFDQTEQRASLKRRFNTCAAKEMEELGIATRKNGIPTLILIETTTGRVLTESAHDDVMKGKSIESTLEQWKALL